MMMKKIGWIILLGMMAWQNNPSVACEFKEGMGKALRVLSELDQAYQSQPDSLGFPTYINTLIQTGRYPHEGKVIRGFPEVVTGGLNLKRSANPQEACLMSKAIIRTATVASESNYDIFRHYQDAFKKSAQDQPKIKKHLMIAIFTAELAIQKKKVIDYFKFKTKKDDSRAERDYRWRIRALEGEVGEGDTDDDVRSESQPSRLQPKKTHRKFKRIKDPAQISVNLFIKKVIRNYKLMNDSLFSDKEWRETLNRIANSRAFNDAFAAVAAEQGWNK